MTLDIALSAPVSQNMAPGGPPGAGPPAYAEGPQGFAAVLAQHRPTPTSHPPDKGAKSADDTRDDKARSDRNDKHGDKDAAPEPALSNSSPAAVQTPPADPSAVQTPPPVPIAIINPTVLPGPAVPIGPETAASAPSLLKTSEAMDTGLAGAAAPVGGNALPAGGELLPQTTQTAAPTQGPVVASPALPAAPASVASASAAGLAASGASLGVPSAVSGEASQAVLPGVFALSPGQNGASSVPGASASLPGISVSLAGPAAASPATKLAVQGYAQFGQTDLQNKGFPANNTGKGGDTLAALRAGAPGKAVSLLGNMQPAALPYSPISLGRQAVQEWAQTDQTEAASSKDKTDANGKGVSDALLMPGGAATGETKPALAPASPLAPGERAALMRQASDSMQTLHTQVLGHGQGQMTLQLHPQDWGKLQVSVTMTPDTTGNGGTIVTAHLVADSAAVKQALETNGSDLRRTLREAGLHLESMTVTVRPPEASTEAQNMGGSQSGNRDHTASSQAQWEAANNAPGTTMAGNGQTAFGGGGHTGAQNPDARPAAPLASGLTDDDEDQAPHTLAAAGKLDTHA